MPTTLPRSEYAAMYGPTTGDRVRLADTDLIIEVERDLTTYGEEVKFGGGKVIRDGMGQSQVSRADGAVDTVITNALIVDHTGIYKADIGLRDGRIADRQGGQPGHTARCRYHHRPRHGGDCGRRQDHHGGRVRQPYPLHLPAADRGGADVRRHHHARRRHRPGPRHAGHHLHAGAVAYRADDPVLRRLSHEYRPLRQGQRLATGGAGRDGRRRCLRAEIARGLGHHAPGHPHLPDGRRRPRCAGDDPHRYAERKRLRGADGGRLRGPHHPRLPHRGRGRRPCAGHHQDMRPAQRAAVLHQPDAALHGQHAGRASRHAHGVPPPRQVDPRRHRLCRKPHPARDDCGGRHSARHGRVFDHRLGPVRPWAASARC